MYLFAPPVYYNEHDVKEIINAWIFVGGTSFADYMAETRHQFVQ